MDTRALLQICNVAEHRKPILKAAESETSPFAWYTQALEVWTPSMGPFIIGPYILLFSRQTLEAHRGAMFRTQETSRCLYEGPNS